MPCEIVPKYLQEEETLNQECKQLVSTLPKERGWVGSHLYHYHGFWYPVRYLQGLLSCHKHFRLENSEVFLVTTPKSGTTWLKAILFALSNRAAFPIAKSHPLYTTNPHDLVPFLEIKLYVDNQIPDLSALPSPRLFSTHLPHASLPGCVRESRSCKIVYLCRNPKDVFVSLWHFTNRLRNQESRDKGTGSNSIDEVFDMFCRGVSLFGPFWDHALEYWKQSKQSPERVMFLRFEDIKLQPGIHIRRLAQFLECPFSPGEFTTRNIGFSENY